MITVKYFGAIAEQTKTKEEEFSFSSDSLTDLLSDLVLKYPLKELSFTVAINQKTVKISEEHPLKDHDIIALLPPFAGG